MNIYQIDPIKDVRWAELVDRHPRASVFHTPAWIDALHCTYAFEPVAFTTSPSTAELKNGVVFCRVKSRITGRRLVSLPFSDHCEPLCDSSEELDFVIRYLQTTMERQHWKYLEMRAVEWNLSRKTPTEASKASATGYLLHVLDLRPGLAEVFRRLDKDSVQRRISRAGRAGLSEKVGRSADLLDDFYRLFVITRSRHQLPPVPYYWFENLIRCLGGRLEMRLAYEDRTAVAGILTLQFRDTVYYKYGCADSRFKHLGAMPWLLWQAISAAKTRGASNFDMGRSEEAHASLVAFKNHWVPRPKRFSYWRFPDRGSSWAAGDWKLRFGKRVFSYMPNRLLRLTGRLIYRHVA
jgi:Acetyltransferase (GNAT) domain